jgi:hypothetical protein
MSETNPEPPSASSVGAAPYAPPTVTASPKPSEEVLDPISADLRRILETAGNDAMSLQQIADHLRERGWAMLVLFLAAPFPIPNIPGLSVPFGIAIMLVGWAFMLRRKPWLPHFVMKTRLESTTLKRVIPFIARLMERMERWTKPRMRWVVHGPMVNSLIGLGIVSGGFFLALPLPIPLTNGPPALSIIFLVVGMLCRDGLMVLIGHILGVLSWAYLGAWIYFGAYLWPYFIRMWEWFKNLF